MSAGPAPRPTPFFGDIRRLPKALASLLEERRWVVWRWELDEKRQKWTKVPHQPDRPDRKARSNDPATWSTHHVAVAVVERCEADGVGYQLAGGEIAAFDLDDCRDPATGKIAPWAWTLIDEARSYTEVTVSGAGIRIIGHALGEHVHRKWPAADGGSLEVYRKASRFIVVTGLPIEGGYDRLADIDPAINAATASYHRAASVNERGGILDLDNAESSAGCPGDVSQLPAGLQNLIRVGVPEGSRSEQFHHAVGWLKDLLWSPEQIIGLLELHPDGIAAKYLGRLRAEIERCFSKTGREDPEDVPVGPPSGAPSLKLRWHGDPDDDGERSWLVAEMIPETGKGLLSGQWGTGKTFVGLDLAGAVMTGTTFAGRSVQRTGGVLFIAAEGANEVSVRLRGVIEQKLKDEAGIDPAKLERLPFAWLDECPPLSGPAALAVLKGTAAEAADRMRTEFDLPLALIVIDTLMAAAAFEDENDAAQGQKVMRVLEDISRLTGAFALAVDHFGKAVETGTRGTSAKEASADVVLALLGEKDIAGTVTNRRMALRKLRGGATGAETPFTLRQVAFEAQETFAATTTCIVRWEAAKHRSDQTDKSDRWPPSLRVFHAALINMLAEQGEDRRPFGHEGPVARTVTVAVVRNEFYKVYPADNPDPAKRNDAKRQAYDRALRNALAAGLVTTREIGGVAHVWPSADGATDRTSTPDRQDTH